MISISTLHSFWLRLLARLALLLAFGAFAASAGAQTTVTFFHNDILGSPAIATDADGAVVWKENYLPYGHRLQAPAAGANNKLWFAGKPYDQTNWITYMGARYYIPLIGRFTGVDPVDFKEENTHSFNRYAYANNNPYKYVDPDGRQAEVNVFPNFDPMGYLKGLAVESIKFTAMAAGGAGGAAEKVVAGSVAAKGIAADAQFAQKTYGAMFSKDGIFAGKSVDEVAAALRSGAMKPSEVPIDYIVRDSKTIILNTRSSQALDSAGVARSEWNTVNRTGSGEFEKRLTDQLSHNPGGPFDTVRRSGGQ
ncbi:RHS repeat domain-containing protein [Acidovorax radicis]|uniref:RHS repeat domain-containing protein n=1 Tax=Acidovorax radicis TaxID=758826 RepID=UPI0002375C73|nr:RHS repeat-associated core domain-containing protein [Acidovorax radicis]